MTNRNETLFSSAPISKAVLSLAVPTVISQLITVVYNAADTFFVGQLGDPNQVAAATLSMPLFMFLTAFANLFGIGGASTISRCLGAGSRERAKQCASFCVWSAAAVSLAYGLALFFARGWLLPLLGTDDATYAYACSYTFWTITIGAVPTVWNAELANLIRAEGYSKEAGFGVAFGGILNIFLDPLFIFVFHMEIAGAAIATALSNAAAAVYFFVFLWKIRRDTTITPSPARFSVGERIPAEVLGGGLPSFVMTMMSTISNLVLNHLIAAYSNEAVAGIGITKKVDLVAYAIAQGMTQGVLPLIAYNYAAGNRRRMNDAIRTTLIYSLCVAAAGTLGLFFGARPIIGSFIADAETVAYGQKFLRVICLACPTTALNFMIITVFQATNQSVQALVLSFLRKGSIDVVLMLLLNHFVGLDGIAWATPLADALALCAALCLFVPYLKKSRETL